MREKLRDSRGETLVEVLASVLICALSVTLLFGAVMASSNIDLKAQEADGEYYDALTKAERQRKGGDETDEHPLSGAVVTVTSKEGAPDGPPLNSVEIKAGDEDSGLSFYGSERLLSYAVDRPAKEELPPVPGPGGG